MRSFRQPTTTIVHSSWEAIITAKNATPSNMVRVCNPFDIHLILYMFNQKTVANER